MDHLEEAEDPEGNISSCFSNLEGQEEYISPISLEEEWDSKWDTSLCFLKSKINFPDSIEEHNPILFETLIRNLVLNSDILDEEFDVSFSNFQ